VSPLRAEPSRRRVLTVTVVTYTRVPCQPVTALGCLCLVTQHTHGLAHKTTPLPLCPQSTAHRTPAKSWRPIVRRHRREIVHRGRSTCSVHTASSGKLIPWAAVLAASYDPRPDHTREAARGQIECAVYRHHSCQPLNSQPIDECITKDNRSPPITTDHHRSPPITTDHHRCPEGTCRMRLRRRGLR
jgi:hypothetical protein